MKKIKKDSIAPALQVQEVGAVLAYPMTRYTSVQNTLTVIRRKYPEEKWSTHVNGNDLEVTREK